MPKRRVRTAMAAMSLFVVAAMAGEAAAQTKVTDKWVTVVVDQEPVDLDGCNSHSNLSGYISKHNNVEALIDRDPDNGALSPRLATAWEKLDATTWRIKLRQGVTFHDGSPFNAAAAKRALDRSLGKTLVCSARTRFFSDLTLDIAAVDDATLSIKTSRPDAILPIRLSGVAIDGPNTPLDKLVLNPVGTGPYAFDSWQAGQQILLKRYDKYWGPKPQVEGLRYIWRNVSSVRAAMVAIGEADIAHSIAPQDATDPKMDFSYLNSETAFLRIDTTQPPLDDRRVRLALNYAIDRKAPIGTIMSKSNIEATQMVFPAIPGHNHDLDKHPYPYDPAKAKQLLAEARAAGVPVDNEITFIGYPARYPNAAELAESLYSMYRAVGFNMKLVNIEPGQYRALSFKPFPDPRPPSVLQVSHDNNNGDPVFSVFLRYGCDGINSAFCDKAFDAEVLRVSGLEGQERVIGWEKIFRTLYEDLVPDVMLYHLSGFIRVSPRIHFVPDATTNNEINAANITFK